MKKSIKLAMLSILALSAIAVASCGDKKVSIDFKDVDGSSLQKQEIKEGESYTLPVPKKEGYQFAGWYTNADYTGEPVTQIIASEATTTYYAKWVKAFKITLNLEGGTLGETTLELAEGENIYDFVSAYKPEKSGLTFGAWFVGEKELSKTAKMTGDITLTAKYKVEYTVEVYAQKTDLSGYEKTSDTKTYSDYVGAEIAPEVKLTGLTQVRNAGEVLSITLTEKASDNVLKLYYDRQSFDVTFNTNYPDGTYEEKAYDNVLYGQEINVPDDYSFEGYLLLGWSTSPGGEVKYAVDYISKVLYNKDSDSQPAAETFTPERDTILYAVWQKGYVDLFGGTDSVYLDEDDEEVVYVSRGGVFFKGAYNKDKGTFRFTDDGNVMIEGKFFGANNFIYKNAARSEKTFTCYENRALNSNIKIYFDAYNGFTYSVTDEDGMITESKGTYVLNDAGYYQGEFTEGNLAGQTINFTVGTAGSTAAFLARNEAEVALGTMVRGVVHNGTLTTYLKAYYSIKLDGFGTATMRVQDNSYSYSYTYDAETKTISFTTSSGASAGVAKVMEISGATAYVLYNEEVDKEFTIAEGGSLKLDGCTSATYTDAQGVSVTGVYSLSSSVLGDYVVSVYTANSTLTFRIKTETSTDIGDESVTVSVYTAVAVAENYAEYYYMNSNSVYYAPLVVFGENGENRVNIYGYTPDKTYVLVAEGAYTLNADGFYFVTIDKRYEVDAKASAIDVATVKSFTFKVGSYVSSNSTYPVNYWYSYTTVEEETINNEVKYVSADGSSLTLVSGYAVYSKQGLVIEGTYSVQGNLLAITVVGSSSTSYVYLEIDEENKSFIELTSAPYTASLYEEGNQNDEVTLTFDGKGGAVYAEGETTYEGTVTRLEETSLNGAYVYEFKAEGITFKFIQLSTSSANFFAKYDEEFNGRYECDEGVITLDGYGFYATYSTIEGDAYSGMYIESDGVVRFYVSATDDHDAMTFVFDIVDDGEVTLRGDENGTYLYSDNGNVSGSYVTLDGYGNLEIFNIVENEEGEAEKETYAIGTYTVENGNIILKYTVDNQEITVVCKKDSYVYNDTTYRMLAVVHEEVVNTYVNEADWSVIKLDDHGGAIKYNENGEKEVGTYHIITDSILYFYSKTADDACIYIYDAENGKVNQMKFTATGYYTPDFDTLQFTPYGFVVVDGETRSYYNKEDGEVTIYNYDPASPAANEYGYVAEAFGYFEDEVVFEGKTYYQNTGYAVNFTRDAATADKYPVPYTTDSEGNMTYANLTNVVFAPSGKEFTSNATFYLEYNGSSTSYTGTVTRLEDGTMYIAYGTFRFYIDVTYHGENNSTYSLVGMQTYVSAPSYNYLYYYYIYYMLFGVQIDNTIGSIEIVTEYGENGLIERRYFNGNFLEGSGMVDLNGNVVEFKEVDYEKISSTTYKVSTVAEDGYTYNFYFYTEAFSPLSTTGYINVGFTRVETANCGEYTVEIERTISSDSYSKGGIFNILLKKGDAEIPFDNGYIKNGEIIYISRTYDENDRVTSTSYYTIKLNERDVGIEEESDIIQPYVSGTVTKWQNVKTLYATGGDFIDYADGTIYFVSIGGTNYLVSSCEYDEAKGAYKITFVDSNDQTVSYYVKIDGETVTFTKIVVADEE